MAYSVSITLPSRARRAGHAHARVTCLNRAGYNVTQKSRIPSRSVNVTYATLALHGNSTMLTRSMNMNTKTLIAQAAAAVVAAALDKKNASAKAGEVGKSAVQAV